MGRSASSRPPPAPRPRTSLRLASPGSGGPDLALW